jgi:hypothetical protein
MGLKLPCLPSVLHVEFFVTVSWASPKIAGSGTQNERYFRTLFTQLLPEAADVVMQA